MQGLEDRAAVALATMKDKAPVDTGRLRDELQMVVGDNVIVIFSPTSYGIWQELGTSRMRAQPFFFPALEEVFPEIREEWRATFSSTFEMRRASRVPLDLNRPFRTIWN